MLNETTVARPIIPQWKRDGIGWRLLIGRRRFGRVIPDSKFPGMWRSPLSSGRLSDMANLAWAKNAVFEAACRELEFEQRQSTATTPSKSQENAGVFKPAAALIAPNAGPDQ